MNRFGYIIISLGLTLFLGGCGSSSGNQTLGKLEQQDLSTMLVRGKTTSAEIQAKLGNPIDITVDDKGHKTWTYAYVNSKFKGTFYIPIVNLISSKADTTVKRLVLNFDKNDRFTNGALTYHQDETRVGLLH